MAPVAAVELAAWQVSALILFVAFIGHAAATLMLRRRGRGPTVVQFLTLWLVLIAVVMASTTLAVGALVPVLIAGALLIAGERWLAARRHQRNG